MKAKDARVMTVGKFKENLTEEMDKELKKMKLSPEHAHYILTDIVSDLEIDDEEELGDMKEIVRRITIDYMEELMMREAKSYEIDWE